MAIEIRRAWHRCLEFGGLRLVCEYARIGLLSDIISACMRCAVNGSSLKTVYSVIMEKAEHVLKQRYGKMIDQALQKNRSNEDIKKSGVPHIIWTCWLQGMEKAPPLVRACISSQKKVFSDYEHRVLTLDNYRQWIEIPEYVKRKYAKGRIPSASFSDLLRLAVLKKYGGVWMDATVLCTGFGNDTLKNQWHNVMNSHFTLCRYYQRGAKAPIGLSTWLIAATQDNIIINTVNDMLMAYWHDYDCTIDYYMIHLFIDMCMKAIPDTAQRMPKMNSRYCLMLGNCLYADYNELAWRDLIAHVGIHKLNYRKTEEAMKNCHSYCEYILRNFQ